MPSGHDHGGLARDVTGPPLPPRGDPAGSERGASTRRSEDELGDQTSEACPPQDESPPAKVG